MRESCVKCVRVEKSVVVATFHRSSSIHHQKLLLLIAIVTGTHMASSEAVEARPLREDVFVEVETMTKIGQLKHFWASTGFCPPAPHENSSLFLLSLDVYQNLLHIASLPNDGIIYIRIHWLLDLITVNTLKSYNENVVYNFTLLDKVLDELVSLNLKPIFELMGNPSNYFTDFEDDHQIYEWRNLIEALARRYISIYGAAEVRKWWFESWNEPDHHDFDGLNFTLKGFLNYYDACSNGLRIADLNLKFGGPGASCRLTNFSTICWAMLQHCYNGTDFFNRTSRPRLDFISFHKKGDGLSSNIIQSEIETLKYIKERYPEFQDKIIFNDEGDPLKGWNKPETWRADCHYAAMVAKVIAEHQNLLVNHLIPGNFDYHLLSNDNGFLNYSPHFFTQRTLLARFQINNTHPSATEFIRKPVMNTMALLSIVGDSQLQHVVSYPKISSTDNDPVSTTFGVIASISENGNEISAMLYNSNDTVIVNATSSLSVNVIFKFNDSVINLNETVYVVYVLDNVHSNPYLEWQRLGEPVFPDFKQLISMRKKQELYRFTDPTPVSGTSSKLVVNCEMKQPSVVLIHICIDVESVLQKVTDVALLLVSINTLIISWEHESDGNKCLLTYEVEYSLSGDDSSFKRVNSDDTVHKIYQYTIDGASNIFHGYYRVRAKDYWYRNGPHSDSVYIGL